jgi:hypothetical protein
MTILYPPQGATALTTLARQMAAGRSSCGHRAILRAILRVPYETADGRQSAPLRMCASPLVPLAVMTERIATHPRERERVALVSSRIPVTLNFYVVTTRSDATRLTIAVRAFVSHVPRVPSTAPRGDRLYGRLTPPSWRLTFSSLGNNEPVHRSVHPMIR